ncbi:MAG: Uma2 family endonuclease [Planctomycetota bacterium]
MGDKSAGTELVRGEMRTMSPASHWHACVGGRIAGALSAFVRAGDLGEVSSSEPGFLLATAPDTVLAPDVAFVRSKRIPGQWGDGYFHGPPDIAVEVLSPGDRMPAVRRKVALWLRHGTRSVWVVNPKRRTVTVHGADGSVASFGGDDVLTDAVLPGFRGVVDSLFPPSA